MSDLFQTSIPDEYVEKVCRVMQRVDWHVYQVLTKRSERLRDLLSGKLLWAAACTNIIWGVSVEDRKYGLPRIDHLRQTPARLRFLSVEPLLEDLGRIDLSGINWVIVGGESGPGSRPMEEAWVLSILEQCQAAQVPFSRRNAGMLEFLLARTISRPSSTVSSRHRSCDAALAKKSGLTLRNLWP